MTTKPRAKIHVRLDNPNNVRKLVLESAMQINQLQKYLKVFKKIRKAKLTEQIQFKRTIREIKEIFHKIEFESLPDLPKEKEIKPKKVKVIKKQQPKKAPIQNKTDRLDQELSDIQEKLNKLKF